MVKITDEMRNVYCQTGGVSQTISALAPLIIAQYEAEKAAVAAPVPFEITSMDQKVQFRESPLPVEIIALEVQPGARVLVKFGQYSYLTVSREGKYEPNSQFDLIPIPPAARVAYVNVYSKGNYGRPSSYWTRADADDCAAEERTGCNRVVLKEGVWDD
jgi:hypothetical protein